MKKIRNLIIITLLATALTNADTFAKIGDIHVGNITFITINIDSK